MKLIRHQSLQLHVVRQPLGDRRKLLVGRPLAVRHEELPAASASVACSLVKIREGNCGGIIMKEKFTGTVDIGYNISIGTTKKVILYQI